jgi:hypothetical protein
MTYNITQAGGAGSGGEGKALDGAWRGVPITISGTPGAAEYQHSFRDRPPGSSAVMLNTTSQVATFTPDIAGDTYRVRLRERATANGPWVTTTKVIRVTKDESGNVVNYGITSCSLEEIPSEANYGSNTQGSRERTTANDRAIVAALDTPWKRACRVVTLTNITLSGLQTIDGETLEEGDRVLVNGQTDKAENGIWIASAFAWVRASDMSNADALLGTTVRVLRSASDQTGWWSLTEPTTGEIEIGTTEIEFTLIGGFVVPAPIEPGTIRPIAGCTMHFAPWDPSTLDLVGSAIQAARDREGGSVVLQAFNTASRPVYNLTGVETRNGQASASFTYLQDNFGAGFRSDTGGVLGNAPRSMAWIGRFRSTNAAASIAMTMGHNAAGIGPGFADWITIGTSLAGGFSAGGHARAGVLKTPADLADHVFFMSHDGVKTTFYIDGFFIGEVASTGDLDSTRIGMYTQDAGAFLADCVHRDAQWSATAAGLTSVSQYSEDGANVFGLWYPGLVQCSGDSMTASSTVNGSALVNPAANAWPAVLPGLLDTAAEIFNDGLGNRTLQTIAGAPLRAQSRGRYSSQRRFREGNRGGSIEIVWGVTNDFQLGRTYEEAWADLLATTAAIEAAGGIPIYATCLKRRSFNPTQESYRVQWNASLAAHGRRYADLAIHPVFQDTATDRGAEELGFLDGTHPTDRATREVVAPAFAAIVNSIIKGI